MAKIARSHFENGYTNFSLSSYEQDKRIGINRDCFSHYVIYDSINDMYLNFHDIRDDMLSHDTLHLNHILGNEINTLMVRHNFEEFDDILSIGQHISRTLVDIPNHNLSLHMYPVGINLMSQSITVSWMNGCKL